MHRTPVVESCTPRVRTIDGAVARNGEGRLEEIATHRYDRSNASGPVMTGWVATGVRQHGLLSRPLTFPEIPVVGLPTGHETSVAGGVSGPGVGLAQGGAWR